MNTEEKAKLYDELSVVCPRCEGRKTYFNSDDLHAGLERQCPTCKGSGRVLEGVALSKVLQSGDFLLSLYKNPSAHEIIKQYWNNLKEKLG